MLFSSLVFLLGFLPLVLIVYFGVLTTLRSRNVFLFFVSIFFYSCGDVKYLALILLSIFANFNFGRLIAHSENEHFRRAMLIISVVFDLGMLGIFKYLGFAVKIFNYLPIASLPAVEIALPLGISFFTFQSMSYVIDVYRREVDCQNDFLSLGLYISFFPQLVAGPIVRYSTVAGEIASRRESFDDFSTGACRLIIGLAKKVILSNRLAIIADAAFDGSVGGAAAFVGALAYMLQIYFDFSGYSDMAIGMGRMFGFHFDENFDYPYVSSSVTEFWRRWHISLGTWFRDYLYIPLGGSRVTKPRLIFNLFVVWTATGLWHGASFNFVLWGIMFFVLLSIEKLTGFPKKAAENKALKAVGIVYTLIAVYFGWILFRCENLGATAEYITNMFDLSDSSGDVFIKLRDNAYYLIFGIIFALPVAKLPKLFAERLSRGGHERTVRVYNAVSTIIYPIVLMSLFVISLAFLAKSTYNPFIYFNF